MEVRRINIDVQDLIEVYSEAPDKDKLLSDYDPIHNDIISYKLGLLALKKKGIWRDNGSFYMREDGVCYLVRPMWDSAMDRFDKYLKKARKRN